MGKLESAIKALKQYEKEPIIANKAIALHEVLEINKDIQEYSELCKRFLVRAQAEELGWMVVENLE